MAVEAIAIDGPVASGKTTVGRLVAQRLGYRFLDTGLMYRAATWSALRNGVDLGDGESLTLMTQQMDIRLVSSGVGDRLMIDGVDATDELRTPEVDRNVSAVSAVPGVRRALVPQQRKVAAQDPVVMVGRDIGTVVLSDARTKVYLDASAKVRAERRYTEITESGGIADVEQVLEDLERRDRIDSERSDSPLAIAEDATAIDTDCMTIEDVVARIVDLVERP